MKLDKVKISLSKINLFRCFLLCVVRSQRRLFFRLNHLRIVQKRCSHLTFRSQKTRYSKSVKASYSSNKSTVVCFLNTRNSNKVTILTKDHPFPTIYWEESGQYRHQVCPEKDPLYNFNPLSLDVLAKNTFLDILEIFRLNVGQISFNVLQKAFATFWPLASPF